MDNDITKSLRVVGLEGLDDEFDGIIIHIDEAEVSQIKEDELE